MRFGKFAYRKLTGPADSWRAMIVVVARGSRANRAKASEQPTSIFKFYGLQRPLIGLTVAAWCQRNCVVARDYK